MPWLRTLSCLVAAGSGLLVTSCPFERIGSGGGERATPALASALPAPPREVPARDIVPVAEEPDEPETDARSQEEPVVELVALRPSRAGAAGPTDQDSAGGEPAGAEEPEEDAEDDRPVAAHPYHPDFGVDPDRALTAIRKQTYVFAEPSWRSTKLGYLRAGAVVKRSAEPIKRARDCRAGWYQVEPQGYVCVGNTASIDVGDPVAVAARQMPDRSEGLPYAYGISRYPTPPFYTKLPSEKDQARVEPGLSRARARGSRSWDAEVFDDVPDFLHGNKQAPTLTGRSRGPGTVYSGRALPKSGFAFLRLFESGGRRFGLSTDMAIMPLDRMKLVRPSEFHGVNVTGFGLPVAFNRARVAALFAGDPKTGLKQERLLGYREALKLSGKSVGVGGARYLETRDGLWVKDEALTVIEPMKKVPGWATPGRTWIEVSILKQTLVAYVGTDAVYATLVSTGADGLGDPKETHSTVRGQFLIHTKHVSVTMSGDEAGDEFDLRDVPYVQYFTEGYAFHAAYWHDSFGKPRSHGCINLSPEDARWLFQWSDPPVPPKWHGAMSLRDGTLVHIHP
ncbi:MAG: L,D-transpeptidase [Myxococcales bacterium]|nr:L,D-transpeptidase [Myxococcales bacterium]